MSFALSFCAFRTVSLTRKKYPRSKKSKQRMRFLYSTVHTYRQRRRVQPATVEQSGRRPVIQARPPKFRSQECPGQKTRTHLLSPRTFLSRRDGKGRSKRREMLVLVLVPLCPSIHFLWPAFTHTQVCVPKRGRSQQHLCILGGVGRTCRYLHSMPIAQIGEAGRGDFEKNIRKEKESFGKVPPLMLSPPPASAYIQLAAAVMSAKFRKLHSKWSSCRGHKTRQGSLVILQVRYIRSSLIYWPKQIQ